MMETNQFHPGLSRDSNERAEIGVVFYIPKNLIERIQRTMRRIKNGDSTAFEICQDLGS
jgi:hypothetical protein